MNLLEPLGLIGLAALAPVIALYFLKLKREERMVPSTLLWKKVIDDMQVNAPFQRLKYSLLLLLQLLLIALMAFALARPYLSLGGRAGIKTLMLIDTSASMGTKDAGSAGNITRLEAAMRDAENKINDMRAEDETMLVAFDRDARPLSKFSGDKSLLRSLLANLSPRDLETRASEALETALALCEGQKDVRILVLSDGCFESLKPPSSSEEPVKGNTEDQGLVASMTPVERLERKLGNVRFVSYGNAESDNVAITQIDARTRPVKTTTEDGKRVDALETQLFVMVENFSAEPREVVLGIAAEGVRFPTKLVKLQGRAPRGEATLGEDVPAGSVDDARSVEVFRLPLGTSGVVTAKIEAPKDKLDVDNTVSVVVGQTEGAKVLLVSKGNYFLEKAFAAMRGVSVTTLAPDDFQKMWDQQGQAGVEGYDVCVFESAGPVNWTDGGALFLGTMPPLSGFVKAEKPLEWPSVVDWDVAHPVMRYVNFGNVTVAKSEAWKVPKTVRQVVEGDGGPLIIATENERVRAVGVSFDIFQSDWVYRPSLPLFLRNVLPWLAEASPRRQVPSQRTGDPLVIPPGAGEGAATLVRPSGQTPEKLQLSATHSTYVKGTETAGLYELKDTAVPRAYAVNLASRSESDNRAQGSLRIGALVKESTPSAVEAKREIWRDLAIAAAILLMLEWWVFHRRVGM